MGLDARVLGASRIPGLRCAPTWALESRPFRALLGRDSNPTGRDGTRPGRDTKRRRAVGPVRTHLPNRRSAALFVSPRWGSGSARVLGLRIPGLRCASTWALESRPFRAYWDGTRTGRDSTGTGLGWDGHRWDGHGWDGTPVRTLFVSFGKRLRLPSKEVPAARRRPS
jgi:hypothetical protein